MLNATADTNIYISALQFGGQPLRFLETITEVKRVLRDKFKWSDDRVREIESRLAAFTRRVTPTEILDMVKSDPDDNRILECAKAAGSYYVVTGDEDLLRLSNYGDIQIVKASEFLQRAQFEGR